MIKFFSKFIKRKEGSTAIEFSFLLMPYFLLSMGIIEISLMFTSESLLEGSVTHASRQIKTGQMQKLYPDDPAQMEQVFRDEVCRYASSLIRCADVVVEVRVMNSFGDFDSMAPTYDEDGNMESQGFDAGGSSDRLLIRVGYRYTAFTPLVGQLLWGPDSSRNFVSTIVMQAEPYDFAAELENNGEI